MERLCPFPQPFYHIKWKLCSDGMVTPHLCPALSRWLPLLHSRSPWVSYSRELIQKKSSIIQYVLAACGFLHLASGFRLPMLHHGPEFHSFPLWLENIQPSHLFFPSSSVTSCVVCLLAIVDNAAVNTGDPFSSLGIFLGVMELG
jgi:hypothetical protein